MPWTAKQFKDRHAKGLGLEPFDHDFEHVEPIPGAKEFDAKLGTPGLHDVAPVVAWRPRESILPPEIFNNYPQPFWRVDHRAPLIHHVPPKLAA